MVSTELITANVWARIEAASREASGPKFAAIAYIGAEGAERLAAFKRGDILVCNASREALRSGATNPEALTSLIDRGVDVRSHERLHAKMVVLGQSLFVGSANASGRSARALAEAVMRTTERAQIFAARQYVLGLCEDDATIIDENFIEWAREEYRAPSSCSDVDQAGRGLVAYPNLFISAWDEGPPPAEVDACWDRHHQWCESKAELATGWRVNISWGYYNQMIEAGDYILWINASSRVFPPTEVLLRQETPSGLGVMWIREPTSKPELSKREVYEQVRSLTGAGIRIGGFVRSPAAVKAIFDLWDLVPRS